MRFLAVLFCLLPGLALAELRILALGDSNTWGADATGSRYGVDSRWPMVMAADLPDAVVIEEGRIGRRTDIDGTGALDNIGTVVRRPLPDLVARHMPLDVAIIMLGTNDLQNGLGLTPEAIARSAISLARILQDGGVAQVLVVAPPPLRNPERGRLAGLFGSAEAPSQLLGQAYLDLGRTTAIPTFDAASVTIADSADGVHLTAEGHRRLGRALAVAVRRLIEPPLAKDGS
jgi:lysophospholipase L1-like esterase